MVRGGVPAARGHTSEAVQQLSDVVHQFSRWCTSSEVMVRGGAPAARGHTSEVVHHLSDVVHQFSR